MKTSLKNIKGAFTLIELLVVIAIIALLTGIVMTNLTGSKAKARDAKRVADLGQIQLALELFFDRCKVYPSNIVPTDNGNGACPSGITFGTFLPKIPTPPSSNQAWMDQYYYYPNGQRYYLLIGLESNNPALQDDVDGQIPWDDTSCDDPVYCIAN